MAIERSFNIAGKDWLTVPEAAHYCGVSEDHFRRRAAEYRLMPRNFMGKQLYEKAALYRAIDASEPWHNSSGIRQPISRASLRTQLAPERFLQAIWQRVQKPCLWAPITSSFTDRSLEALSMQP
jgi:hypothetical protein